MQQSVGGYDDEPPPDYDDVGFADNYDDYDLPAKAVAPRIAPNVHRAQAPAGDGAAVAPRVPSKIAPPPRPTSAAAPSRVVKKTADLPEVNLTRSENLPDWLELIHKLRLTGLAKQLAQQSELVIFEESRLEVCCESRVLAGNVVAIKALEAAVNQHYADAPKAVKVHVGKVSATPAKVQAQIKHEELAGAQAIVAQNPTVQALVAAFDGMILPNSIKAI